jgi:hypothetical protein
VTRSKLAIDPKAQVDIKQNYLIKKIFNPPFILRESEAEKFIIFARYDTHFHR